MRSPFAPFRWVMAPQLMVVNPAFDSVEIHMFHFFSPKHGRSTYQHPMKPTVYHTQVYPCLSLSPNDLYIYISLSYPPWQVLLIFPHWHVMFHRENGILLAWPLFMPFRWPSHSVRDLQIENQRLKLELPPTEALQTGWESTKIASGNFTYWRFPTLIPT